MLSVTPLSDGLDGSEQWAVASMNAQADDALGITKTTASGMTLTWNASKLSNIRPTDPFKIEKLTYVENSKGQQEETWVQVGENIPYNYTIGNGIYAYELTGLDASTEYTFRISYGSTSQGVAYSNRITGTTLECELKAESLSSTSIKLSWNIAGKNGTYFQIMQKQGDQWVNVGKVRADGSAASAKTFTVSELEAGKEYEFKLEYFAPDSKTETDVKFSQIATGQTLFTLDSSTETTGSVQLSWDAALGGTNHVVQICPGNSSPSTATNWTLATTERVSANEYRVTGLKENTSYYFRVRYTVEIDGKAETRYTDVLNYASPTSIKTAEVTENSAKVSWTFSGKSGTSFYIQTSLTGEDGSWSDYPGANTTSNSYTLSHLEPGTKYYVRVRYTSTAGNESYSAPEEITTKVAAKLDSVTQNSVKISWDIPNIKPGSKVNIQRCDSTLDPSVDVNWKTIATEVFGNDYTNENLGSNRKYFYRVSYVDVNDETQFTMHVEALTGGTLSASSATSDTVKLDWNFVPKQGSYLTVQFAMGEYPPQNDAGWGEVLTEITLDADHKGCTVSGLTPGQIYYFRVLYTSDLGTEEQVSTVATITTDSSNLVATRTSADSVTLRWAATGFTAYRANTNFVVYKFEYSNQAGAGEWVAVTTVDASKNSYTVEGLLADTQYQFKIEYEGGQAGSNTITLTTDPYEVVVSNASKNGALLSWSFDTDKDGPINSEQDGDGEGRYIVQRYTGTGEPSEAERLSDDPALWADVGQPNRPNQKSYNLTGLEINSTQYYRVVYTYRTGDAEPGEGTTWTVPLTTKYSALAKVETLSDIRTTFVGMNRVTVQWDAQTLNAGTRYTVQKSLDGTNWTTVASTSSTSCDFTGLAADTEYQFRVLFNSNGSTQVVTASTEKYSLSVTSKDVGLASAGATFEMKHVPGIESNFKLYYRQKAGVDDPWPDTQYVEGTVSGDTVSFSLTGLRPETEYEFKTVYESDVSGSSVVHESEWIGVMLSDDLMPSDVQADSVRIRWDASNFPERLSTSQYILQWRKAGSNGAWSGSGSLGASTDSFTATNLDANTDYEFRVQYATVGGATAYSSVKTVRTGRPEITATVPQFGNVKLAWNFSSANGFVVQYKGADNVWRNAKTVSGNNLRETTVDKIGNENLEPETTYAFRIAYTTQSGGETVYSEEIEITTTYGIRIADNSLTSKSVTVQWDYTTESVYKIQYREAGTNDPFITVGDIAADKKEHTISGLNPGVEYEIVLTYVDIGEKTASLRATTPKIAPEAPTGLTVTDIKSGRCKIKWNDNSEYERNYIVELKNNRTGQVDRITVGAGVGIGPMEEILDGLISKTSYTVTLYAQNDEGVSTSLTATFTTADVSRLNSVSSLKAVTTPKSITLNWSVKSVTDVPDPTQFRIEYYDAETKLWYEIETVSATSWTVKDSFTYGDNSTPVELKDKTTYQFRVTALGFTHEGETFAEANPTSVRATTASLVAATKLAAKDITMTSATISFTDTDKTLPIGEKTYQIGFVAGKFSDWSKVESGITWVDVPQGEFSATLRNLVPGTTYTYVVLSSHDEGGVLSKPSNFTTSKPTTSTSPKSGFTLTSDHKLGIEVAWKPPAGSADLTLSYQLKVSGTGKSDSFITLTVGTIRDLAGGQKATTFLFEDVIRALRTSGQNVSKLSALTFQIVTVYSRDGTVLSSSQPTTIKISLPAIV